MKHATIKSENCSYQDLFLHVTFSRQLLISVYSFVQFPRSGTISAYVLSSLVFQQISLLTNSQKQVTSAPKPYKFYQTHFFILGGHAQTQIQ